MSAGNPILTGMSTGVARWTARGLAIFTGLFYLLILVDAVNKLQKLPLPFALAGAPFGTWEQSTQLHYLVLAATNALFLLGALLAFRWEAVAARILLVVGAVQFLSLAVRSFDPTLPRAMLLWTLALGVLPPLVIAGLLLLVGLRKTTAQSARSRQET